MAGPAGGSTISGTDGRHSGALPSVPGRRHARLCVRALPRAAASGKHAAVACSQEPGRQYRFLKDAVKRESFPPRAVVTVDVAAPSLLGEPILSRYGGRVDLCLDHHASRQPYARLTYVDASAAAAAEVIYELIPLLGAVVDEPMASCLYTAPYHRHKRLPPAEHDAAHDADRGRSHGAGRGRGAAEPAAAGSQEPRLPWSWSAGRSARCATSSAGCAPPCA